MAPQRRYAKREKLAAVLAAEMGGLTQASDSLGIPKSTLAYWMDQPAFADIRTKTREDLADEVKVVAHLAWRRIAEALRDGTMEPRDALFAAEKATSLRLLMSGEATGRTETRDLTGTLSDDDISAAIRAADEIATGGRASQEAEGETAG